MRRECTDNVSQTYTERDRVRVKSVGIAGREEDEYVYLRKDQKLEGTDFVVLKPYTWPA